MSSKSSSFFRFVHSTNFAVYVITETWFHSGILDSEFFDKNYTVYRCDRNNINSSKSGGGGVLIAVHSSLNSAIFEPKSQLIRETISTLEFLSVKVTFCGVKIYLIAVYIPDYSSIDIYSKHCECVSYIVSKTQVDDIVCVLGDFNLPNIKWQLDSENDDCNYYIPLGSNSISDYLCIDCFQSLDLKQVSGICNGMGRLLDLVFINEHNLCNVSESLAPFMSTLYHKGIEILFKKCDVVACPSLKEEAIDSFNFYKADFCNLNSYLENIDWNGIFLNLDINDMLINFYNVLFSGFERFVPLSKKRISVHPPWYNEELINLRNRKNKANHNYKKFNSDVCHDEFLKLKTDFNNLDRILYKNYIENMEDDLKKNPKRFWKYCNEKRKISGLPSSMFLRDVNASSVKEVCDLFATFFQSVYKTDYNNNNNNITSNYLRQNSNHNTINIPKISEENVLTSLIDFNDGCGPDGISTFVLKQCSSALLCPLVTLFNQSLLTGIFPEHWKSSYIVPIFKSGKRADISNYRGISILSAIPKLFEHIICEFVFFNVKEIINIEQHGFFRSRSTTTNLLEFTSETLKTIEAKSQMDAIYTDFSKAFDSIQHHLILHKLSNLGFSGNFLNWIESYLTNRIQFVQISGIKSKAITVRSGVPQGSHLGPIIFNLFINDIVYCINYSKCLLYADDLKIFRRIDSNEDCEFLQKDIDSIVVWCDQNKLQLNINKCSVMSYYRKVNPIIYVYKIANEDLNRADNIVDLGVTFDKSLTFNDHISKVISKSYSMLGFICRMTKDFNNYDTLTCLYCSFVRSILEYAAVVWSPMYQIHIDRIEQIQKKFILFALRKMGWPYDSNVPYWENISRLPPYYERCKIVNIESLVERRVIAKTLFVADIITNRVSCPNILKNVNLYVPSRTLRGRDFIFLEFHRTNYGMNEPLNAACRCFNENFNLFDFNISRYEFKKRLKAELS